MIDQEVFKQRMALLADRIGRTLAGPTQLEYYRQLSAELTTEQFVAAMALAFKSATGEYRNWPSPQQLVEMITPVAAPSLTAGEAFERVLELSNDPRIPVVERREKILALGATTMRAFKAAGGRREFENVLEADVKWLRKSFVAAYEDACTNADAERAANLALASASEAVQMIVNSTANAMPSVPGASAKRIAGTSERKAS